MIKKILLFVLYNDEVSINDSDKWVFPIKQTAKHKFVTLDDVIGIEQWIYIRLETARIDIYWCISYAIQIINLKKGKGKVFFIWLLDKCCPRPTTLLTLKSLFVNLCA